MRPRSIIHLNVADFAVAVERQADCRLRTCPVIIAPEAAVRAEVYDMSEEAYQDGVRKGMPLKKALRFCSGAKILPPHPDRYEQAMMQCFKRVLPYSPLAEMTDQKGHIFVDVTGSSRLFGPPPDIAWRIRNAFRSEMGLDPIWSVASNKLVAKVATRLVKPSGEYIVREGEEACFLQPLPLYLVPGILPEDRKQFGEFNLSFAGQVAGLTMEQLDLIFGKRGHTLFNLVRGIDLSPVQSACLEKKGICFDHLFGTDTSQVAVVEGVLYCLTEKIGSLLRRQRLSAKNLGLTLDFSDGKRVVRQAAARPPVHDDLSLFSVAKLALKRAWTRRVRIRHMSLSCNRFESKSSQLELFAGSRAEKEKNEQLMSAIDRVRQRFGSGSVRMGRTFSLDAA
jgi:DNA polymerase IV